VAILDGLRTVCSISHSDSGMALTAKFQTAYELITKCIFRGQGNGFEAEPAS
jgi:hypothetical protein